MSLYETDNLHYSVNQNSKKVKAKPKLVKFDTLCIGEWGNLLKRQLKKKKKALLFNIINGGPEKSERLDSSSFCLT